MEPKPAALISADSLSASHRAIMPEGGGGGLTPGKTERSAALMAINGPPPGGSPQVATQALPPERSTRACSRRPRRQSVNRITPKIENAASKLASATARASPSISRAPHRRKGRSRSASRRTMPGAMAVASTAAPRSAAGPLIAPPPSAAAADTPVLYKIHGDFFHPELL